MAAERERLQKEMDDLQNSMSDDKFIAAHFEAHGSMEDRTNAFAAVVMSRVQVEMEAAELEAKQPCVA